MKRYLVPFLLFAVVAVAFASDSQVVGSTHAKSGSRDVTITLTVCPDKEIRLWVDSDKSFAFLLVERDTLARLVDAAAAKIDIAAANKTTIAYRQDVGRFATAGAALVSVSFETHGDGAAGIVLQLTNRGSSEILLLDQKETQDFMALLGKANILVTEYNRQLVLFK